MPLTLDDLTIGDVRKFLNGFDEPDEEIDVSLTLLKATELDGEMFIEGMVLVPEVTDRQGDVISEEEIRKSAYRYMRDSQFAGEMHERILPGGDAALVESFIAHKGMKRNGLDIKKGAWFVKFHVLSERLKKFVREGRLNSFSIGGRGRSADED